MPSTLRLFAALIPPAAAVEHLDAFLEPRRDADPDLRWAGPEQWHLTLAFAPDVPEYLLDDVTQRLASAAQRRRLGPLAVAGGGAFPDPDRARVLWAALAHDVPSEQDELTALARGARTAFATAGADVDGQRFRAHLTLAAAAPARERDALGAGAGVVRRAGLDTRDRHPGRVLPRAGAAPGAPLRDRGRLPARAVSRRASRGTAGPRLAGMPVYAVHYTYSTDAEKVAAAKPEHRAYLATLVEGGALLASGPYVGTTPDSALLIFRADSADAVRALLAKDPIAPLVTGADVTEWNPTLGVLAQG